MLTHTVSVQMLTARCAGNGLNYRCAVAWHSEPMKCPRCNQQIDKSAAPVMLDGGRGSWVEPVVWNQQHGCGEWVTPYWATSEPESLDPKTGQPWAGAEPRDHYSEARAAVMS